jgi:hypothetical protein
VGVHLLAGALEAILAETFKIYPLLPISPGLAVDPAGVPMMGFTNKRGIHKFTPL